MKSCVATLTLLALLPSSWGSAGQGPTKEWSPEVAGVFQGNTGCVIVKRQYGTRKNWLATGTLVMVGEYEVVQTFRYDIKQTKFKGQDGVSTMTRIAHDDLIKFVIIPSRYSPEQLDKARVECQKGIEAVTRPPGEPSLQSVQPTPAKADTKPEMAEKQIPAPYSVPPEPDYRPSPACTEEARKHHVTGTIPVELSVTETGSISDIKLVRTLGYGLDQEVLKTLRIWRFKPALKDGIPVPATIKVEVNFGPEDCR